MIILLIFESFAREKKQEPKQNLTIVLNLFAEIIVHLALFISVSMHQKMGIESNNVFFTPPKTSDYIAIYALFRYPSISSPRFALHGTAAAENICQAFHKK